jgi:hypothetical protein
MELVRCGPGCWAAEELLLGRREMVLRDEGDIQRAGGTAEEDGSGGWKAYWANWKSRGEVGLRGWEPSGMSNGMGERAEAEDSFGVGGA